MGVFRGVKYELSDEDRVLGGKSRSPAKIAAAKVNALKHGKSSKDPTIKEAITPTSKEKALGITTSDKIKQLKRLNPLFASENRFNYLYGVQEFLGELLVSALRKKKEGKSTDYEYRQLTRLSLELFDRFYGKPDTIVNVQQNLEVTESVLLTPTAAPVAAKGLIYFDSTANKIKVSEDGATFVDLGGDVTEVIAGSGLTGGGTGGSITLDIGSSTGIIVNANDIAVDVGTGPNQIVQLDGTSKLPAVDGSQLTNLPSTPGETTTGVNRELKQQIEVVELLEVSSLTSLVGVSEDIIVETFSDADGFNNLVNVSNTDATHDLPSKRYKAEFVAGGGGLIIDDFDRADSATVGNGWTEVETTGSTWSIVSNRVKCDYEGSSDPNIHKNIGNQPAFDIKVKWESTNVNITRPSLAVNGDGIAPQNGLSMRATSSSGFGITRNGSVLASTSFTFLDNTEYFYRLQWNGSTLKGKVWKATDAEPGSFQLSTSTTTVTDNEVTLSCIANASGSEDVFFEDLQFVGETIETIDDFNRANSATVGNGWTEDEGFGTWQILSNKVRGERTSDGKVTMFKTLGNKSSMILKSKVNRTTTVATLNFRMGFNSTSGDVNASGLTLLVEDSGSILSLLREGVSLASTTFTVDESTDYFMQLSWDGSTFKGKIWKTSESEPSGYQLSASTTNSTGDKIGFTISGGGPATGTIDWDDVEIPANTGLAATIDDFNRANSTTIGNGWTEDVGNWEISGNELKGPVDNSNPRITKDIGNRGTFNVKAKIRREDTSFRFSMEINNTTPNLSTGMKIAYDDSTFSIGRAATGLASTPLSFPANTDHFMRLQFDGTDLKGTLWDASGAEPSPQLSATTTNTSGTGILLRNDKAGGGIGLSQFWDEIIDESITGTGPGITERKVELDLPTISGTVTDTQLASRFNLETGNEIKYELEDASANKDTDLAFDTKNTLTNLVSNPTKLRILLKRGTGGSVDEPNVKSIAMRLFKS